ncbi:MAG TPA: sulfate adenylyltransferase, partial [Candidatus Hydrogenedentes bacterium]|nr:sulfate adenylyltransferase [Candidatus Hydrogenedentota bacterium]
MLIAPHGGELVDRILTGPAREEALAKAQKLPKVSVDTYASFDIDGIAKGLFSPATGFMNEAQVRRVLDTMHLREGVPWTIPLMLAVDVKTADGLEVGGEVAIEDDEGDVVAILHLSEKFAFEHGEIAEKVYLTRDEAHPGVAYTMALGSVFLAGDLDVLKTRTIEFQEYNRTPKETRAAFVERGWSRIVAFQTRNPIHRAH